MLALLTACSMSTASATVRSEALGAALHGAPRLGLGMASLGRPGYINLGHADDLPTERTVEAMRLHAHDVLDEAYNLGLRYIDCARSYGMSEEFVASWLAKRPEVAADVVIGSKWGYEYTADWRVQVGEGEAHEVKKHTVAQFTSQLEETRALLKDRLALYQIHSATEESGVLTADDVLDALAAKLRDAGVAAGASVSHPQATPLELATAAARGDKPLFASVQATFNLLDQSAAPQLKAAHESGLFVIIKEALANGRLTSRAPDPNVKAVLAAEAERLGTTADAVSLAWVLSHEWVSMVLSGASSVEMLRANADALRITPLPADVMERLGAAIGQPLDEYWSDRKALAWN